MAGLHSTLIQAIYDNDIEVINQLLPRADIKFNDNELLRVAVRMGNLDLVDHLIKLGGDIYSRHCEVLHGSEKMLKLLLQRNVIYLGSARLASSLHLHPKCAKLLLPYLCNHSMIATNVLRWASRDNVFQTIKLLFPLYNPPENVCEDLVAFAARGAHVKIVKFFLPFYKPNKRRSFILSLAAVSDVPHIVKLLLPYTNPKAGGSKALRRAVGVDDISMVKLLLPYSNVNAYADRAFEIASRPTRDGRLARLLLPYSNHQENK